MIAEIDSRIREIYPEDTPGAAVAVIHAGEVIHASGYGRANLDWDIPITTTTTLRLASITKFFTAASIMLLAQRGVLDPHDSITRFLPEYHTGGHTITLHHLLTHTSGIHGASITDANQTTWTPDTFALACAQNPLDFAPGTRYSYNNAAYTLLGLTVERASGLPFSDFLRENFFTPLNMSHTGLYTARDIVQQRATGYAPSPDGWQPVPHVGWAYSAGGLSTTLEDMILWEASLRQNTLLSPHSMEIITTPVILNDGTPYPYGYGWMLTDYEGHPVVLHSGEVDGFTAFFARFVADDFAVIVLSNRGDRYRVNRATTEITRYMVDLPPVKHRPFFIEGSTLARCIGHYAAPPIYPGAPLETYKILVDHEQHIMLETPDGDMRLRLLPVKRNLFYYTDYPEMTIAFDDEQDGRYQTMTLNRPFWPPTTVYRIPDPTAKDVS